MKTLSISALLASLALSATFATAQDITPTRVGPVSQYGQLMTGKNSQGQGRIYGSCEGVKDGAEVQVRGMSLYWSLMPQALEFWSEEGISTMVNDMKIQIVRAAMATGNEDWKGEWNGIQLKGYAIDSEHQKQFVKTGPFFYSMTNKSIVLRDRSKRPDSERKMAYVPPEERALLKLDDRGIKKALGVL